MWKVGHYCKCAILLSIRYFKKTGTFIVTKLAQLYAVLKCLIISLKAKREKEDKQVVFLKDIYLNNGELSKQLDFVHQTALCDLSIIIPMFNVEDYIVDCLNSVLCQKTKYSLEVILIDDGSTDNTIERVRVFHEDMRVTLLRQENKGQSVARNKGIYHSKGKYIMFVDGDDILIEGAIDRLLDVAKTTKSDIVEGDIIRFTDSIEKRQLVRNGRRSVRIKSSLREPKFVLTCYGYSCAKVYDRKLWKTLRFPEGYIFEDVITKFILRRKSNQVAFINVPVYGYRQNPHSSSHGKNVMKKLDSIWVFPKVVELCNQEQAPKDTIFYLLALNHIGILNYSTLRPHEESIKRACFEEMQKQLDSIQEYKPRKLPIMFKLLNKAITAGNFENWNYIAATIVKYNLLKGWREIN